jgi:hypothetical protein
MLHQDVDSTETESFPASTKHSADDSQTLETEALELEAAWSTEADKIRRRFVLSILGVSLFATVSIIVQSVLSERAWHLYCGISALAAVVALVVVMDRAARRARNRRSAVAEQVVNYHDKCSIGTLVDSLRFYESAYGNAKAAAVARAQLTEVLPKLSATEASALIADQRTKL